MAHRGLGLANVNPLDWVIVAAGPVALSFSFFNYYTESVKGPELTPVCRAGLIPCSDTYSAWHGFFGWFGVLLLVLGSLMTSIAMLDPQTGLPTRLITLGAAAIGLLFTFVALLVIPHANPRTVPPGRSITDYLNFGHGFSYWIILALAIAATGIAIIRVRYADRLDSVAA